MNTTEQIPAVLDLPAGWPALPKNWTREKLDPNSQANAAACPEGLLHVNIEGAWALYVPWFRDCWEGKPANLAVLRHRDGSEVVAKIDHNNTITTPGGRKVGCRKWYH